ncbi:RnfABCDGE type electron transport complex subunit B [Thiorhodospira sibirica]|uniref:RnfABCDGE type electron transport complex subunit B n=1 Tax=Thiorhodospira sibirica TaxID=154347 RepID=UPI00022C283F|nr:RnfABCDGE type electron transport complex subunit B [Thiorhodospira sibirica]
MIEAIITLTTLGMLLGLLLGIAAKRFKVEKDPLVEEIEALLPGSNCGQCGLAGCAIGAQAIVDGKAPITLCPPGGKALVRQLADKLKVDVDMSSLADKPPAFARVREEHCIGCTRCFKVCPTDAIIGAPKQIHSVLLNACNGCGSCAEVCPTSCVEIDPVKPTLGTWCWPKPVSAEHSSR